MTADANDEFETFNAHAQWRKGQASGLHQVRLNRVSEAWAHKVSIQSWEKSAAFFPRVLEMFSGHDRLYLAH